MYVIYVSFKSGNQGILNHALQVAVVNKRKKEGTALICLHRKNTDFYLILSSKKSYDKPSQHTKKQRHYFTNRGPQSQSYGFFSSHVWM